MIVSSAIPKIAFFQTLFSAISSIHIKFTGSVKKNSHQVHGLCFFIQISPTIDISSISIEHLPINDLHAF